MKKFPKNQPPCPPIAHFLRKVGSWPYTHADTIDTCIKNTLDVICLFVGLGICYGFLLLGGTV